MKLSADKIVTALRLPARLLDVRCLIVVVCLFLLVSSRQQSGIADLIDRQLFYFSGIIQNHKLDGTQYIRVTVPAEMQEQFMREPAGANALLLLIDEVSKSFVQSVAFVLPHNLPGKTAVEQLLMRDSYSQARITDQVIDEQIKAMALRWQLLDSVRVNQKYIFAIRQPLSPQSRYNLMTIPGYSDGWYGFLLDPYPVLPAGYPVLERQAPLLTSNGLAQPLIWQTANDVRHDAVLEVFLRQQGLQHATLDSTGIQAGEDHRIKTSAQGVIYPRVTQAQYQQAGVVTISVAELLKQNVKRAVHGKNIVIGSVDNPDVERLLNGLISLDQGYYAYIPGIYLWLDIGILILVALFALLVPYIALSVGCIAYGLMVAGFIFLQQVFLLVHSEWIPVGEWLVFLTGSYLVMVLWGVRQGCFVRTASSRFSLANFRLPSLPVRRPESRHETRHEPRIQTRVTSPREPVLLREMDDELVDFEAGDTVMMDAETIRETRRPHNQAAQAFFRKAVPGERQIPASAKKMLGPYEILGELGRGAMGVVYLGFDPMMHRKVAIKTLHYNQFDPIELVSMKERFTAEAKAVGKLRHHNIVTMYELREEHDMAYIAMDYVAGKSLASYTNKENLLPVSMVYWIIAEVADALAYAHAAGVVHRDIKPSNILYDENAQEVKVADFGVARLLDSTLARTKTGEVLGSPLYMSPEQIRGDKVTGQSDIYSLGVTFYQLLTGELPFKADNIATLTRLILQGKFPAVDDVRRDLPASARKIINKALQKNLESRYADALEMVAALDQALKKDFG